MLYRAFVLAASLIIFNGVNAQSTTLFIPGYDEQPLTADVLGVDGGRTTFEIKGDFPGAATLVEASDYVSLHQVFTGDSNSVVTVNYDCAITTEVAFCSGKGDDGAVVTESMTVSRFAVQVGTTAAPSAFSTPATTTPSITPSPGAGSSSSASKTGTSATASSTSSNGSGNMQIVSYMTFFMCSTAAFLSMI
ncbi:hypothetical protein BDQ12DRAFT_681330 [Crucibulum laeve]|uniref:Uncharacterized protein n=1 Tax=Crucibulum laeve TaxID=68775 RepID=A0A5C3M5C9_9AGAR|nr:hypothetical protein BDQ12DRAFT_681330 [Crucibulum laeve]